MKSVRMIHQRHGLTPTPICRWLGLRGRSPGYERFSGGVGRRYWCRGFTLVELLVSVMIFSIVMMIAVGSLLSMIDANRKAQSLKSVVNNLAFALDNMSRTVRDGNTYHCGGAPFTAAADCAGAGSTIIAVEKYGGSPSNASDQVVYCRGSGTLCSDTGTAILRSTDGGANYLPITSSEVVIENLRFYVTGSLRSESPKLQPKVLMVVRGYAGVSARVRTEIKLQTTITQRLFDE